MGVILGMRRELHLFRFWVVKIVLGEEFGGGCAGTRRCLQDKL